MSRGGRPLLPEPFEPSDVHPKGGSEPFPP